MTKSTATSLKGGPSHWAGRNPQRGGEPHFDSIEQIGITFKLLIVFVGAANSYSVCEHVTANVSGGYRRTFEQRSLEMITKRRTVLISCKLRKRYTHHIAPVIETNSFGCRIRFVELTRILGKDRPWADEIVFVGCGHKHSKAMKAKGVSVQTFDTDNECISYLFNSYGSGRAA